MKAVKAAVLMVALLVFMSGCTSGNTVAPNAGVKELSNALSNGKATMLEFYSDT